MSRIIRDFLCSRQSPFPRKNFPRRKFFCGNARRFPLLIAEGVCFNRGVNSARPESFETNSGGAPAEQRSRVRLRMRPPARDSFSSFVYACVALLLIGEFVAMFWLDIFG